MGVGKAIDTVPRESLFVTTKMAGCAHPPLLWVASSPDHREASCCPVQCWLLLVLLCRS